jgi:FKBP-type peptidyl-prolyl cis-trans isomerase
MSVALLCVVSSTAQARSEDGKCRKLHADFDSRTQVTRSSGLRYSVLAPGNGQIRDGQVAVTRYFLCSDTNVFIDGSKSGDTFAFTLGAKQVIVGFEQLVRTLGLGGKLEGIVPYELAYGIEGRLPAVPPRTNLLYRIELVAIDKSGL